MVSVSADTDGDDDLPFGHGPMYVSVAMAHDATTDQVLGVLDLLDEELDEDEIENIEIRLAGPKTAHISTCYLRDRERLVAEPDGGARRPRGPRLRVLSRVSTSASGSRRRTSHTSSTAADRVRRLRRPTRSLVVAGRFRTRSVVARTTTRRCWARGPRFVLARRDAVPPHGCRRLQRTAPLELWTTRKHRDALRGCSWPRIPRLRSSVRSSSALPASRGPSRSRGRSRRSPGCG